MKHFFCILFFMTCICSAAAQIQGEDEVYLTGDRIEAKFNGGGIEKFSEFIKEQFNYSKVKKAGKMVCSFTIDEQGTMKNIRITQMLDSESGLELLRVLNKCPKWQAASRGGKPISIDIQYPMVFNVR